MFRHEFSETAVLAIPHYRIQVQPYGVILRIVLSPSADIFRRRPDVVRLYGEAPALGFEGACSHIPGDYCLWLTASMSSTIYHEVYHAVDYILADIGILHTVATTEVYAYLYAWLLGEVQACISDTTERAVVDITTRATIT